MKQLCYKVFAVIIFLLSTIHSSFAQCSICTKTAEQLGEGPAQGLNSGILYLMATPLAIGAFIGYKWWKNEKRING